MTPADNLEEFDLVAYPIVQLKKTLNEAVATAPEAIRAVIEALQGLRGVVQETAQSFSSIFS